MLYFSQSFFKIKPVQERSLLLWKGRTRKMEPNEISGQNLPIENTGCVIMASGLGKRFGGSKLLALFQGKPMISHILDATNGVFVRRVVVTRSEEAAAFCRTQGVEVVLHREPYRSDTVRLGLEALGDVSHCMFCPADQPLLKKATIQSLALCGQEHPDSIWRPACQGQVGAPILFPKWTFAELLTLPQGKGGGFVAKSHPEKVHCLPIDDPAELADIDTQEDLARLEALSL